MKIFKHQLEIVGPHEKKTTEVPVGTVYIGREAGVDLRLDDLQVSRQHAQLACEGSICRLIDLASTNGTSVNDKMLEPNEVYELASGDVIEIGPFTLTYTQISVESHVEEVDDKRPLPPSTTGQSVPSKPPPPPFPPPDTNTFDASTPPPGLSYESTRLINYLPDIYHTPFMQRFLAIFEAFLLPIEWNVNNFDLFLDPQTAPVLFLPWLANWFGLFFDASWRVDQQRTFLAEAHQLYARRGTKWALSRVLQIYTGCEPEIIDLEADHEPFTFTIMLDLPANQLNRPALEQLINTFKPAHTAFRLQFAA